MAFWDLLGTLSALSIIQDRNQAKKVQKMTPQMAALGSSFGNRVQKASMVGSAHILKLAKTFEFLSFFEGLGSQVELRMEALRGTGEQLGAH